MIVILNSKSMYFISVLSAYMRYHCNDNIPLEFLLSLLFLHLVYVLGQKVEFYTIFVTRNICSALLFFGLNMPYITHNTLYGDSSKIIIAEVYYNIGLRYSY